MKADKRITNTEGGSFNSHYGIKVFGNSHGMLQSYRSTRHSPPAASSRKMMAIWSATTPTPIGRAIEDLQSPEWVGKSALAAPCRVWRRV
ncbi:hypothetical protein LNP25_10825 [Klebsiella variicola subsp. variicola]|nr:hypothetical protein [Klebsiella variicola subsp. variicola]